jgi:hypothetical protein
VGRRGAFPKVVMLYSNLGPCTELLSAFFLSDGDKVDPKCALRGSVDAAAGTACSAEVGDREALFVLT